MLERISVENFKGLRKVEIGLSPLTVFVGENGTGKSTVLHALSMLRLAAIHQGALTTELEHINLGPLPLLIPPATPATIRFAGWSDENLDFIDVKRVHFECSVNLDHQGLSSYSTKLELGERRSLENEWYRYGPQRIQPEKMEFGKYVFNFAATAAIGSAFRMAGMSIVGEAAAPERRNAERINQSFGNLSAVIASVLRRFFVVGPFRGVTEPFYVLQSQPALEYTTRAGTIQLGANLAANLVYNSQNVATISDWENEIVGVGVQTEVVPPVQVLIKNPKKKTDFVNEGFGAGQLLFVLERVANSPLDSSIAIEEPEIHLHPKAQFNFGKWASTTTPKLRKQLIILTHSPDIVSGILTGVRRKSITPEDVSIWFFELKDKEIITTKSEVDKEGEVTGPALRSFLESTAAQLSEYT